MTTHEAQAAFFSNRNRNVHIGEIVMSDSFRITTVRIRNFMGITRLEIDEAGKFNQIKGENGAGKSSVLFAIQENMRPSRKKPFELIREGADSAEVYIALSGPAKVEIDRKITLSGKRVTVEVDGRPVSELGTSPQAYLDTLLGPYLFDPTEFFLADPKVQIKMLMAAIDIKLTQEFLVNQLAELIPSCLVVDISRFDYSGHGLTVLSNIQEEIKELRLDASRARKSSDARVKVLQESIPEGFDPEKYKGFDIAERMAALEEAQRKISEFESNKRRYQAVDDEITAKNAHIELLGRQLAEANTALQDLKRKQSDIDQEIEAYEVPNTDAIKTEVSDYQAAQAILRAHEDLTSEVDKARKLRVEHEEIHDFHHALVNQVPRALLKEAEFPIEGLQITGDQITVNGKPLSTQSTSERIKLSLEIAKALAPPNGAKIICFDRFESLTPNNRKMFEAATKDDGFEYFVTIADDVPELTVESD